MSRRTVTKFTDAGGDNAFTFPVYGLEWDMAQAMRNASAVAVGAGYAYDQLDSGVVPKELADETVRFNLIEDTAAELNTALDTMRAQLRRNGKGKLWNSDDSTNRWAWARGREMPAITLGHLNISVAPVVLAFQRFSDWYAETETAVVEAITASPTVLQVESDGTAEVTNLTVLIAAGGASGFVNPTIENSATGDSVTIARTAVGANDRLRIQTGPFKVEYSADGGDTWSDDYANVTLGATQAGLLTLAPGINDIEYRQASGVPDATVTVSFFAPYE